MANRIVNYQQEAILQGGIYVLKFNLIHEMPTINCHLPLKHFLHSLAALLISSCAKNSRDKHFRGDQIHFRNSGSAHDRIITKSESNYILEDEFGVLLKMALRT